MFGRFLVPGKSVSRAAVINCPIVDRRERSFLSRTKREGGGKQWGLLSLKRTESFSRCRGQAIETMNDYFRVI